jgi:flagellar hook-associated protein 2
LVFDSSASSLATAGTYAINVTSLAATHKLGSASLADSGASVITAAGEGVKTFRIAVGAVTEDISVTLAAGDTDNAVLAKIMDAITAGSAVAKASLIKETSGNTTLVIEAKNSGSAGQITLSDTSGTLLQSVGALTALGAPARELQPATDASFTIGGSLTITRSSNEISDAITGITINLKKEGAASLTVSADTDAVAAKFSAFVSAYNAAQAAVGTQLTQATSESDPTQGVFYGNRQLRALRSGLRLRLAESRALTLSSMSAIGLKPVDAKSATAAQSYNVTLDTAAFKAALQSDPSVVQELLSGTNGILTLAKADLDAHLGVSAGTFAWMEASASSRVATVDRRLVLAQKAVTQKTAYYNALYTSLAGKIAAMQQQSAAAASIYNSVYGTTSTTSTTTG